jgi:DNA polymerase-3 subunit epsilon
MKDTGFPLQLERPLAFFDIESTGISPRADRIIELAVVRIHPDGNRDSRRWLVNPGIAIPPETTRIHGFTDADVKDCPPFPAVADSAYRYLEGCDLGGYNLLRFDVPMLVEEFARAGLFFDIEDRNIVDVQRIFHQKEPRDLTAALAFYCGEMHLDAHGAEADVLATIRVLEGQYRQYNDLPQDMNALDTFCNPRDPDWADRSGRLKWENGSLTVNFGKNKGRTLKSMLDEEPGFVRWMLRSDFPRDTKAILEDVLQGVWPEPPQPGDNEA